MASDIAEVEGLREKVRRLDGEVQALRREAAGAGRLVRKTQRDLDASTVRAQELEQALRSHEDGAEEHGSELRSARSEVARLQRLVAGRSREGAEFAAGARVCDLNARLRAVEDAAEADARSAQRRADQSDRELSRLQKDLDAEAAARKEADEKTRELQTKLSERPGSPTAARALLEKEVEAKEDAVRAAEEAKELQLEAEQRFAEAQRLLLQREEQLREVRHAARAATSCEREVARRLVDTQEELRVRQAEIRELKKLGVQVQPQTAPDLLMTSASAGSLGVEPKSLWQHQEISWKVPKVAPADRQRHLEETLAAQERELAKLRASLEAESVAKEQALALSDSWVRRVTALLLTSPAPEERPEAKSYEEQSMERHSGRSWCRLW